MDAARAAQYVLITQAETTDLANYPIENALGDLRKYYDAGTMLGGLQYIQGQMQSQSQSAAATSQSIKTGRTGLVIASPQLQIGTIGTPYPSVTLSASGGTAPYKWSVSSGAMPTGLTLDANSGVISGTPESGTATFTVQVADSSVPSQTATENLSITVNSPPATTQGQPQAQQPVQPLVAPQQQPQQQQPVTPQPIQQGTPQNNQQHQS